MLYNGAKHRCNSFSVFRQSRHRVRPPDQNYSLKNSAQWCSWLWFRAIFVHAQIKCNDPTLQRAKIVGVFSTDIFFFLSFINHNATSTRSHKISLQTYLAVWLQQPHMLSSTSWFPQKWQLKHSLFNSSRARLIMRSTKLIVRIQSVITGIC